MPGYLWPWRARRALLELPESALWRRLLLLLLLLPTAARLLATVPGLRLRRAAVPAVCLWRPWLPWLLTMGRRLAILTWRRLVARRRVVRRAATSGRRVVASRYGRPYIGCWRVAVRARRGLAIAGLRVRLLRVACRLPRLLWVLRRRLLPRGRRSTGCRGRCIAARRATSRWWVAVAGRRWPWKIASSKLGRKHQLATPSLQTMLTVHLLVSTCHAAPSSTIAVATHPDEQAAPRTGLARQRTAAAAAVAARRHTPRSAVRHRGLVAGMQATLHQRHKNSQQLLPA